VGVIEAREEPRLTQQLAEVDALLVRHLERDFLVDPRVSGELHGAEPAAADRRQDLVLPDDLSAKEHLGAQYSSGDSTLPPGRSLDDHLALRLPLAACRSPLEPDGLAAGSDVPEVVRHADADRLARRDEDRFC